jgi:hypothetical protein
LNIILYSSKPGSVLSIRTRFGKEKGELFMKSETKSGSFGGVKTSFSAPKGGGVERFGVTPIVVGGQKFGGEKKASGFGKSEVRNSFRPTVGNGLDRSFLGDKKVSPKAIGETKLQWKAANPVRRLSSQEVSRQTPQKPDMRFRPSVGKKTEASVLDNKTVSQKAFGETRVQWSAAPNIKRLSVSEISREKPKMSFDIHKEIAIGSKKPLSFESNNSQQFKRKEFQIIAKPRHEVIVFNVKSQTEHTYGLAKKSKDKKIRPETSKPQAEKRIPRLINRQETNASLESSRIQKINDVRTEIKRITTESKESNSTQSRAAFEKKATPIPDAARMKQLEKVRTQLLLLQTEQKTQPISKVTNNESQKMLQVMQQKVEKQVLAIEKRQRKVEENGPKVEERKMQEPEAKKLQKQEKLEKQQVREAEPLKFFVSHEVDRNRIRGLEHVANKLSEQGKKPFDSWKLASIIPIYHQPNPIKSPILWTSQRPDMSAGYIQRHIASEGVFRTLEHAQSAIRAAIELFPSVKVDKTGVPVDDEYVEQVVLAEPIERANT